MATLAPPSAPGPLGPPDAKGATGRAWRLTRLPILIVLLLVVGGSVLTLANLSSGTGPPLDPYSYTPDGANALRTIVGERDVDVTIADSSQEALSGAESGTSTVFVPRPEDLNLATIRTLGRLPASTRVVLLQPDPVTLRELLPNALTEPAAGDIENPAPNCSLPEATAAGDAELAGTSYRVPGATVRCYDGGLLVVRRPGGPELVLLGDNTAMRNENLTTAGNAALMMNLLSARPRLFWLNLSGPETTPGGGDEDPRSILPSWTGTALLYLSVVGVFAALWRGRRLGAPVAEPLPVVVRSAESVEGRARMYRRAKATDLAAEALRAGALSRITPTLGLGPDPDPRAACPLLADRTRRTAEQVHRVLYGPTPATDAELVTLSNDLDALVADVLAAAAFSAAPGNGSTAPTAPSDPEGSR